MMTEPTFIYPDWPAPPSVRACVTTRQGGYSEGRYSGFNLATHVEDREDQVLANRRLLRQALQLPAEPCWLEQVHGVAVVEASASAEPPQADASFTRTTNTICTVLTADCLPLLICNRQGTRVAAAHAGWRGLQAGVIERTVDALGQDPGDLLVWLGPAIGPDAFEVGDEVRQAFEADMATAAEAFRPARPSHWLADLYLLARQRLARLGVESVYGGEFCTYTDAQRFYSYRRDGKTGRMASLIWIAGEKS
jgi:YfiH family protein